MHACFAAITNKNINLTDLGNNRKLGNVPIIMFHIMNSIAVDPRLKKGHIYDKLHFVSHLKKYTL